VLFLGKCLTIALMEKLEITYPTTWSYKLIGSDKDVMMHSIQSQMEDYEYTLIESNQSRTGKFTSLKITAKVASEEERVQIFEILKHIPTVRIIL